MTIKDPSLSVHGYQLLPLATSYIVGNNRYFDVSGIFLGVLLIVVGGEPVTIEDPSLSGHLSQLLPLATRYLVIYNRNLMLETYFEVFYSLLVEGSL